MNICRNCNVIVYDDTDVCPLCHSVLDEMTPEEMNSPVVGNGAPYPDVRKRTKRVNFISIYNSGDWADCDQPFCNAPFLVVRNQRNCNDLHLSFHDLLDQS